MKITDRKLKCVKATTFPGYASCYGQNTQERWIFPCQDKPTEKEEPEKPKPKPKPQNDDD